MKISLITVCYNSEKTIEETLNSVLMQNYTNYEYLIIDGLSTDHTMDIIYKKENEFKGKLRIISEKDKGLYDAMNKGIKMSTGDIIGILNSDDVLINDSVFEQIITAFSKNKIDGTYSDLIFFDEKMEVPVRDFIAHYPSKKFGWHPPHPTLYLKKDVYDKVGYFDLQYRIAADYDFMLRLLKQKPNLFYIKNYLVKMRSGGVSTDGLTGYFKNLKEADKVLRNNNISFPIFCNFIRIFKTIWQSVIAKINSKEIIEKLDKNNIKK